jgi:hypothetical protein
VLTLALLNLAGGEHFCPHRCRGIILTSLETSSSIRARWWWILVNVVSFLAFSGYHWTNNSPNTDANSMNFQKILTDYRAISFSEDGILVTTPALFSSQGSAL